MQEFQWEYQNFRDDVEFEFMNFFIENKEVIFNFLDLGVKAAMKFLNLGKDLFNMFQFKGIEDHGSLDMAARSAQTRAIAGNTSNVNVNIDNTFNNVAKSDQTWLANAGEMTYEQLIRVLYKGEI